MAKISTTDVKVGGTGMAKTIAPGINVVKINAVKLVQHPFMVADDGYYLMLDVETKPIEDFEGFFIDKDNESLGRYAGQIGQVKTSRYFYKDGETKSGIAVNRNMEILKIIKNICLNGDMMVWFDGVNDKFETIEEFVEAFQKDAPFKGKWFSMCVAGKEFARDNGYIGFDLYFPKLERGKVAVELENTKPSRLLAFDEASQVIKVSSMPAPTFKPDGGEDIMDIPASGGDLDLGKAPQFEL